MKNGRTQFSIDRTTGVPPFLQIVEQVKESLYTGKLSLGDYLPSISEVVRVSAINANTVMKAYRELETLGVAQALQGVGTIIIDLPKGANPILLDTYYSKFEALIIQARQDGLEWEPILHLASTVMREIKAKEKPL